MDLLLGTYSQSPWWLMYKWELDMCSAKCDRGLDRNFMQKTSTFWLLWMLFFPFQKNTAEKDSAPTLQSNSDLRWLILSAKSSGKWITWGHSFPTSTESFRTLHSIGELCSNDRIASFCCRQSHHCISPNGRPNQDFFKNRPSLRKCRRLAIYERTHEDIAKFCCQWHH